MIYTEKGKDECPFVSVNTIARGRILPRKQHDDLGEAPPYQAKQQADQSRAPSRAETNGPILLNAEEEPDFMKDSQKQEFEELQAKSMTTAASGANGNPAGEFAGMNVWAHEQTAAHNLSASPGSGHPLPENVEAKMEQALGTDFTDVRLHHDAQAVTNAERLGAKAFTHKTNIYFNQGEYQPETSAGKQLLAHELTHVKQQMTVPGLQAKLEEPTIRERYEDEADAVANVVTGSSYQTTGDNADANRSAHSSLSAHSGRESIQLKAKPEVKPDSDSESNWFLEQVSKLIRNIPGYDLLALAIGRDPLTGQAVNGDGLSWAKAVAGLLPGGALLFENLEKAGVITRAVAWLKAEIEKLGITFAVIKDLFDQAWTAIVGPQTPEKESEPKKKGWFANIAEGVKDLASKAASVGSALFTPEATFEKIKEIFTPTINRIISFLGNVGPKLMEFTFEGALALAKVPVEKVRAILNKGKGVLQRIITDPVGFLSNLLQAIHGGLQNFLQKFGTYLQAGLAGWLFGALSSAGITFPAKLDLAGIFSLIAQILGVTWQTIKTRVIKLLGPTAEKVIAQVEKTVAVVAEFITKGPIALYEMAVEFLGDLKARFFDSVIEWARNTIIVKGVQKLIAMFNPVGAIVQAIMTIGSTIKFFIDKAKEIAAFANAVFDSITEIAAGNLKKAIIAVENSLARALPMAISFMASLAGIGGIAAKIKDVIKDLRKPIDKAIEKVVGFVADKVRGLLGRKDRPNTSEELESPEKAEKVSRGLVAIEQEEEKHLENNKISREDAEKVAVTVKRTHPVFKSLTIVDGGDTWDYEYVASPGRIKKGPEKVEGKSDSGSSAQADTIKRVAYEEHYTFGKNGRKELKPNIEYITPGGHKYTTDELGRIREVEGRLRKKKAERKPYDQRVVGREERLPTDEGGHLIASIFEGSGELDNLVPMDATLNRSDWRAMERSWAEALDNGENVEVRIKIIYVSTLLRPIAFKVQYRIGAAKWQNRSYPN